MSAAQLFCQLEVGGRPSTASAGKILYWPNLNRVDVEDARYRDLDQIQGGLCPNGLARPRRSPRGRLREPDGHS